eukprot:4179575-Alexandrium_andersonii.AAC.1
MAAAMVVAMVVFRHESCGGGMLVLRDPLPQDLPAHLPPGGSTGCHGIVGKGVSVARNSAMCWRMCPIVFADHEHQSQQDP